MTAVAGFVRLTERFARALVLPIIQRAQNVDQYPSQWMRTHVYRRMAFLSETAASMRPCDLLVAPSSPGMPPSFDHLPLDVVLSLVDSAEEGQEATREPSNELSMREVDSVRLELVGCRTPQAPDFRPTSANLWVWRQPK